MLPPLAACRRALVVAAAAVLTSPRSLRAAADVDSTAGLRLDGAALQRARQQQLKTGPTWLAGPTGPTWPAKRLIG